MTGGLNPPDFAPDFDDLPPDDWLFFDIRSSSAILGLPGHSKHPLRYLPLTARAKKNQKAVSGCASLTACVSHVWESYPGDTPTASVIIAIIRMRMIATEQLVIMVSRRLVIERASSNWFG